MVIKTARFNYKLEMGCITLPLQANHAKHYKPLLHRKSKAQSTRGAQIGKILHNYTVKPPTRALNYENYIRSICLPHPPQRMPSEQRISILFSQALKINEHPRPRSVPQRHRKQWCHQLATWQQPGLQPGTTSRTRCGDLNKDHINFEVAITKDPWVPGGRIVLEAQITKRDKELISGNYTSTFYIIPGSGGPLEEHHTQR